MSKSKGRRRGAIRSHSSAKLRLVPASSAGGRCSDGEDLAAVLATLERAAAALHRATNAVAAYRQRPDVRFNLDELDAQLGQVGHVVTEDARTLRAAEEIARTGEPVATTYGTGSPWAGPQRPRYVLSLAERARAGDTLHTTAYLDRLGDAALNAAHDPACPHTTGPAHRCPTPRVRRPDGTRARACWGHLTTEERAEVRAEREAIVAVRGCPTCAAAAGQRCVDERRGVPISIHQRRLTTPQPTA